MVTSVGRMTESPGKLHWVGGGRSPHSQVTASKFIPLGTALGDGSKRHPAAPRFGTGTVLWHTAVFLGTLLLCVPRRERFSPKTCRSGSGQRLEWVQDDAHGKVQPGAGAEERVQDLQCWHPVCVPLSAGWQQCLGVLTSRHNQVLYLRWQFLTLAIDLGRAPPARPRGSSAAPLHP